MIYTAILPGDCRATLATLPPDSVDAVVTDPPYELGFMGKGWDSSGVAFDPVTWSAVLRVLKPGGHMLAFSGTRTYHRMVCAIEDAGFEIRDQLAWLYGSGFPKSLDVSKAIDASLGAERVVVEERPAYGLGGHAALNGHAEGATARYCPDPATAAAAAWDGWGTALKPAQEPIVLARKPLAKGHTVAANVLAHGTGGINVDASRIEGPPSGLKYTRAVEQRESQAANHEQVAFTDHPAGRWPANVLLDEAAAAVLDEQAGHSASGVQRRPKGRGGIWTTEQGAAPPGPQHGDSGGASRFFYVAKASRSEREAGLEAAGLPVRTGGELTDREDGSDGLNSPRAGAGRKGGRRNHHPTVKPIALMRYLVRLITPPGGVVLDPFTGSGSTGVAAVLEGFHFVGCELGDEYLPIIHARIAAARAGLTEQ